MKAATEQAKQEASAVFAACIAGGAAFLVGLLIMQGSDHEIAAMVRSGDEPDEITVSRIATFAAGIAAAGAFLFSYLRTAKPTQLAPSTRLGKIIRALAAFSIATVTFALGYLGTFIFGQVFQQGFLGLRLDGFSSAIAIGIAAAAAAYLAHPLGFDVSTEALGAVVPSFLVVGVVFSMLTASDEHWWELHFSELGAGGGLSGFAFNATLVVSGMLVATLGAYVARDLELHGTRRHGAQWVGRLLAIIGGLMVLVGLVRVDIVEWLHIVFASGMVVVFIILCCLLPKLAPELPRIVHIVSLIMVGGVIGAVLLWVPIGYYNFTGFEFAAAGLIFVWLTVFVRVVAAGVPEDAQPPSEHADSEAQGAEHAEAGGH